MLQRGLPTPEGSLPLIPVRVQYGTGNPHQYEYIMYGTSTSRGTRLQYEYEYYTVQYEYRTVPRSRNSNYSYCTAGRGRQAGRMDYEYRFSYDANGGNYFNRVYSYASGIVWDGTGLSPNERTNGRTDATLRLKLKGIVVYVRPYSSAVRTVRVTYPLLCREYIPDIGDFKEYWHSANDGCDIRSRATPCTSDSTS